MTTENRSRVNRVNPIRLDGLLALPIAVKLAIGLIAVLVISGLIVDAVARGVVTEAQRDLVYADLQSVSRSQAFALVDLVGQEVTALNRFSETEIIQAAASQRQTAVTVTSVYQPAPGVQTTLSELRTAREEFSALALVNPNGVILGIDPIPEGINTVDPADWVWFDSALADGEGRVYISATEEDFLTGQLDQENDVGVSIAIPVYRNNNPDDLVGVLYGLWNLSNVAPSAVGLEAAERQVSVLQLDGTVLVSPTNTPGTRVPPAIRENIEGQLSGSFETRAASGAEFLYGFSRLDDTGIDLDNPAVALRWVVLTRQPAETATAGANLVLGRLRAALFAAVFLALLVIAAVSRLVTRPLIRLTDTASELAQGNLSTPIPDLPKDEVGQLAEVLRQLVERLLYRVRQLNAAVQVSQATATTLDVEPMLRLVTRSLTEQFGIPEVRAFVLNADASRAQLMVGLGPESQRLARSGYSVKVDENTLPGRAMFTREEQYTGGFEAPAFAGSSREPAQLALPLQSGPDLYGVLHVIADEPGAFERQDINVLSLIADQVASSIKNARLLAQSQANLAEIETLNRRLTQEAWTEFLEEERSIRHTTDLADNWPNAPAQRETLVRSRDVVEAITYTAQDGRVVLSAPLLLRGEAIGVLAVTRPPGSSFTRDEVALLESVTSRMALIAEGIRLVEESNRRAAREQMISDVSARLFEQTDNVEAILQGALGELGAALGSQNVSLRLGEPPADEDRQLNPPDEEAHHENGAQQTEVNDDDTD